LWKVVMTITESDSTTEQSSSAKLYMPRGQLQQLLDTLHQLGYEVVGPRIDQEAIVYDRLESVQELPIGWSDQQSPGHYRLTPRQDQAMFGYVVGPHSWKKFLFPPLTDLMVSRRTEEGWSMQASEPDQRRYALLGVRACELAAIAIQDRVFMSAGYTDPIYAQRRTAVFIVAVNCTQAAPTCFCTSMNTGPHCTSGFDLALTELTDGFVVEVGSEGGQSVVSKLTLQPANPTDLSEAQARQQQAADQITKHLSTEELHDRLLERLEHPQWDDVAQRCLGCANCTLVCPTCFCHSVDDVTDLTKHQDTRQRRWDSCFNFDFSHVSGGPVRDQIRSRYRQWLTHKLVSWIDQFGTSGCVGCGRCITWCPVGIDLTQEVAAICGEQDQ
jgi:ferredoxin